MPRSSAASNPARHVRLADDASRQAFVATARIRPGTVTGGALRGGILAARAQARTVRRLRMPSCAFAALVSFPVRQPAVSVGGLPLHPRPLRGVPLRVALRGVADNHPSIVPMVTTIGMNIATIKTMKKKAAATKTATFTANVLVLLATYNSFNTRAAISPPKNKT